MHSLHSCGCCLSHFGRTSRFVAQAADTAYSLAALRRGRFRSSARSAPANYSGAFLGKQTTETWQYSVAEELEQSNAPVQPFGPRSRPEVAVTIAGGKTLSFIASKQPRRTHQRRDGHGGRVASDAFVATPLSRGRSVFSVTLWDVCICQHCHSTRPRRSARGRA